MSPSKSIFPLGFCKRGIISLHFGFLSIRTDQEKKCCFFPEPAYLHSTLLASCPWGLLREEVKKGKNGETGISEGRWCLCVFHPRRETKPDRGEEKKEQEKKKKRRGKISAWREKDTMKAGTCRRKEGNLSY